MVGRDKSKALKAYLDSLSEADAKKMAFVAIERLIETEEVFYRPRTDYGDGDISEEGVFWDSCGESLLD